MPDYAVVHLWHDADGETTREIVPGSFDHVDLAFYAADLITEAAHVPTAVYALDPDTAQMFLQQRPEPTLDPSTFPRLRVLPGSDGGPPDLVTAPTSGVGMGAAMTQPPQEDTGTETTP